ncbi:MAG: hypothetical protein IJ097_04110 [Bacilli bacterium]|nr:hypothetical protein [Bacilli bacterium]
MYPYQNPSMIGKTLSLLKNIKWGALLDGTQKTLGVINQAIPVVYQVKPIINNAKTMFKIANIMNTPTTTINNNLQEKKIIKNNNSPIFYI